MQPILQIKLLGGFDLSYDGKSLTVAATERLQSLLTYLVLYRHTPQFRQHLAFLFWSDSTESQARTNLRRAIHDLRRILPDVEQFIEIDSKALQWRLNAPFILDVVEFEQAIANAETAEQATDPVAVRAALEQAADLYQGRLLPNCYDEWLEPEQERLHQACIRVYTWLMRLLQAQQETSAVVRYAQRLLRIDPLNEDAYAYLMQSYALSGDRANALQIYHRCMTILRDELGVDPSPATRTLYEHLLNETDLGEVEQKDEGERIKEEGKKIKAKGEKDQETSSSFIPHPSSFPALADWGDAPDVSLFYGRTAELTTLQQWIEHNCCRLVTLLGMGGIGKTALAVKVAQELVDGRRAASGEWREEDSSSLVPSPQPLAPFQFIIWRSLRNAPPLTTLLAELVPFLSNQQDSEPTLNRLMYWLRTSRCLLILDNVETILQGGQQSGTYRPGYEAYSELLQLLGETAHQSCLILTSREKPAEIATLEGLDLPVRSLLLGGSPEATMALIQSKGLFGSEQQQQQLCQLYGHNPLALKIVATSIQDLFDGDIAAFLAQDTVIFNSLYRLVEQQCQRCTPFEKTVMSWLATNQDWTTIAELAEKIVPRVSRATLLEALESLRWRSLIEKRSGSYTLPSVVREYISDHSTE